MDSDHSDAEYDKYSEAQSFVVLNQTSRSYASSITSSVAQSTVDPNDEEAVKRKVVIFNLDEPFGDEADREADDINSVKQILLAIDSSSSRIISMARHGKYRADAEMPRRIVVEFDSEADRRNVLFNAKIEENIKNLKKKFKQISITEYRPPHQRKGFGANLTPSPAPSSAADLENERLKEKVAEMERQVQALLLQKNTKPKSSSSKNLHANQQQRQHMPQQQPSFHAPMPPQRSQTPSNMNPNRGPYNNQHYANPNERQTINPNQIQSGNQFNQYPHYNQFYHQNQFPPQHQFPHQSQWQHQKAPTPNAVNTPGQFPQQQPSNITTMTPEMIQKYYNQYLQMVGNGSNANTPLQKPGKHQGFNKGKKPQKPMPKESSSESEEKTEEDDDKEEEEEPEYQNELFGSQIADHRGMKQTLNILVLGETGVGKSTWINAIANYMTFNTLDEAMEAPKPICLIANKFTFYQTTQKKTEIITEPSHGEKDENEMLAKDGESVTQDPKTYQFQSPKYIVNIIDTPGIGDTRGFDQDRENTRKIMNALSTYKNLHAICFLFKSNESKLTNSFRYCISSLLLQLHKSAIENIIFFFTNVRESNYKPGATYKPLKQFLDEIRIKHNLTIPFESKNTCCTDNEGFRLVCAHAKGVRFTENEYKKYAKSWEKSAAETHRFLEIAATQRPLSVADQLSINKARTIILNLSKPLAGVNELIESNIKLSNDRKKELQNTANDVTALKGKLKYSRIAIEVKALNYPKTVCASSKCIETEILPDTEQYQTIYKQICHDHCYLTGVDVEKVPEPHLAGCAAMRGQNCHQCGCHWNQHMHIRFDQMKVTMEVEDPATKSLIKNNEDAAAMKQQMIKTCEAEINELKAEQQKIIETSLRFGGFLRENAILPYNDAFEKYVEQTISEEEKCVEVGGGRSKLDNLKKLLAEYQQEKKMMEAAQDDEDANNRRSFTPDEIDVMKAELFALKRFGNTIQNLFTATEEGIAKNNKHMVVKYVPEIRRPQAKYKTSAPGSSKNSAKTTQKKKSKR